ncbi:hypothetical protein DIS24_g475 [Lasiodiplodia hormozganensis]|uniref:Tetraspanin Tsp3 n=1 Tax=Lasiodiplodia hormozganensis TaxID=869390 RepID=A0AA40D899_9PEZI|nr:hypothetical protein DIS24_g475 [Lasiodiplodia hormozganensis]
MVAHAFLIEDLAGSATTDYFRYAHYTIQHLALPIPTALSFLVIILPVAQGLSTWYLARPPARRHFLALPTSSSDAAHSYDDAPARASSRHPRPDPRARIAPPLLGALTIFATALATLSGTHLAPADSLNCALRDQWLALFRTKNGQQIKAIQDALQCCGFRTVYDMAWPFPQSSGGKTQRSTCSKTFERDTACFSGWRKEEQKMAGLLVVVCLGAWACQMIVTTRTFTQPSWLQRFVARNSRDQASECDAETGDGDERPSRAIDFHNAGRYTDNPSEDLEEVERGQPTEGRGGVAIENSRATNTHEHHTMLPSAHGNGHNHNHWSTDQH